jgi:CxxC-x17-CxxC domain-containing protein
MRRFDNDRKPGRDRGSSRGSGRGRGRGRDRDSGGFDQRDSGSRFGGRRERPEMHQVICDKCGVECEVPFKPTSSKPVYCSDCFEKNEGSSSRGGRSGPSSGDLEQINNKLDKIMQALEIE